MKRWGLVLALVLSLGMNAGILAMVAMHRLRPPIDDPPQLQGPSEQQLDQLADWMRLEGGPREQFLDLQRRFLRGMQENGQEVRGLHHQLRREVMARQPDRALIDDILETLGEHFEARERLMVTTVLDSHELLDRRQRRQYHMFFGRVLRRLSGDEGGHFRGPERRPGMEMEPGRPGGRFRERPFSERRFGDPSSRDRPPGDRPGGPQDGPPPPEEAPFPGDTGLE